MSAIKTKSTTSPNTNAAPVAVTTTAPVNAQSPSEIVARLTDAQRRQVIEDAAHATFAGKPLRLYKAFKVEDVLRTFRGDQTFSEELSRILNIGHTVKLGEAADIIARRNGIQLDGPQKSVADACAMEAERLQLQRAQS
jgi:hypothetical protein